jgi:hypothetical protein
MMRIICTSSLLGRIALASFIVGLLLGLLIAA